METTLPHTAQVALQMQRERSLSGAAFSAALGRDRTEWAHVAAGRRAPSPAFVQALRAYAVQQGGFWPALVDLAIQKDALAKYANVA